VENQAIILHQGSRRLRSLAHVLRYKQIDAESRAFFAEHPGYSMKDVSVEVESLCIEKQSPGAAIEDNNMNFTCELVEDLGLGSVLETETITIRVYETPIVESLPLELTSVVGGPASVKCTARGRPNLQIRWRNKDTQEIYATEKFEMLDDGKAELSLTLTGMKEEQDGQKLVCEATTSYPPNQPPAHQVTTLSVKYPPRLEIKNNAVYTELGATEDIAITVYGNPPPELNCDLLNINEPRELELVPGEKQGVRTYHLRLHEVKKQDVGDYKCSAVNELGSSTVTVRLTLSPSPPEVISPKFANHADYYLLGWRSRSKSPLRNVTFRIHSTEKSAGGVDTVELESKGKVKTVSLEDQLVAKANTNASDWQEFWHHISNLSHNSEHRIYLSACNQYGCSNGSSEIPHVTFRTPKDDSSNRIDPALLEHPPSAALLAAASRDFEGLSEPGKDGATWPASVTLLHTCFVVFLSSCIVI
uniref:Ig-like domain-containing protein n=1 Tax=Mesocestoides corti TaxID=53468 RepID=A0A5K3FC69_MESCO